MSIFNISMDFVCRTPCAGISQSTRLERKLFHTNRHTDFLRCRLCSRMKPQVLFSEQIRSQRLDVLKPMEPKNKANSKANGKCWRKKITFTGPGKFLIDSLLGAI